MKKMKHIFLLIGLVWLNYTGYAQLANSSFEKWNNDTNNVPEVWIVQGNASVSPKAHAGTGSLRLNMANDRNALVYYGNTSIGVPFKTHPDTISFYAKGLHNGNDQGKLTMYLAKESQLIAGVEFDFALTDSVNWTLIKAPIIYTSPSDTSDSIFLFIESNTGFSTKGDIFIDDIQLSRNGQPISNLSNPGFEQYKNEVTFTLANYYTSNDIAEVLGEKIIGASRTTDAASGNYAIKLVNKPASFVDVLPGMVFTATTLFKADLGPSFPMADKYKRMSFSYKYKPQGSDTALGDIAMFFEGVEVGRGKIQITNTVNTYTRANVTIVYPQTFIGKPDSAAVLFSAGSANSGVEGSEFFVDDIEIGFPLGEELTEAKQMHIYPNPSKDIVFIEGSFISQPHSYAVYDVQGRMLKNISASSFQGSINIQDLESGIYIIRVAGADFVLNQNIIIQK
jgi:hypothetical protein